MVNRKAKGFTLLELLVVVGILFCLVGILLPALTRVREQGRRAECLSNLRSLTVAWLGYATDNEGHICSSTPGPTWSWTSAVGGQKGLEMGKLWPYLNNPNVYRCPDDQTAINNTSNQLNGVLSNSSSYQINGLLAGTVGDPFPRTKLNELAQPAKTFVFIEGCSQYPLLLSCFNTPIYPVNEWGPTTPGAPKAGAPAGSATKSDYAPGSLPGENHLGIAGTVTGTGISFADGHAIFWEYADLRTGNLQLAVMQGVYNTAPANNGYQAVGEVGHNSPDVLQVEAWSGSTVPPGASQ